MKQYMYKIVVLEKIEMTEAQKNRLNALGNVEFFNSSDEAQSKERVKDADVAVIDWIDPNSFLESMKKPSLLALMSTGYDWINIKGARAGNISVSNVPGYATEAVAEHIIGLMFAVARKTVIGDANIRKGRKEKGCLRGVELSGRRAGIIGLGKIGCRVAKILACFGMEVVAFDSNQKNILGIKIIALDELLQTSDAVFVTCSATESAKNMLTTEKLELMKPSAILLATTWGVVELGAITQVLKNKRIFGAGFDVSIEGGDIILPDEFIELENVVLTPHIGYNTEEAKTRQVDICISNIEKYLKGSPENIVN